MYLLDTNVISDAAKKNNPPLNRFLKAQPSESLFISTVSLAEISFGINKLPTGKKKTRLLAEIIHIKDAFDGQILDVTAEIALKYGQLHAKQLSLGFNDDAFDSLIIATAIVHNLTVVTRNKKDFVDRGVKVFYPS